MTREPEIALVFAPEPWFEALHRHLSDHGGARVRQVVMDPALALVEAYDTLVASHRWPGLTHHLVDQVHALHRTVLGVYDPAEPAGREFLARLGVDGVVASDGSVGAFLEALGAFPPANGDPSGASTDDRGAIAASPRSVAADAGPVARTTTVGGTPGAGRTEVALALSVAVARGGAPTVLADVDELGPSLVQRLGLPIEPNLRTAIDAVQHDVGEVEHCLQPLLPGLDVLGGLPNVALWSQIRAREVLDLIESLSASRAHVIADVASSTEAIDGGGRGRFDVTRSVMERADTIVGVGTATPVGVNRLLAWMAAARELNQTAPVHLVVNHSDRSAFREAEIERELSRSVDVASLTFLPEDRRVDAATWAAEVVTHGLFIRAIGRVVAAAFPDPQVARPRRRARPATASMAS